MDYTIERADWNRQQEDLLDVRFRVFVEEQGVPPELEHDDQDARATHLLARDASGTPIATARMLADGHIGRMAVMPAWRGRGVGSALLRTLLDLAVARGHESVFLHAQCSAEGFYRGLGFVADGGVFIDAGIDHRCMRRQLDRPSD